MSEKNSSRSPEDPQNSMDESEQISLLQEAQRSVNFDSRKRRASTPPSLLEHKDESITSIKSTYNSKVVESDRANVNKRLKIDSDLISPPGFHIQRKRGMWPPYGAHIRIPALSLEQIKNKVHESATTMSTNSSDSDDDNSPTMQPASIASKGSVHVKSESDGSSDHENSGASDVDNEARHERNSLGRSDAQSQSQSQSQSDGTHIKEEAPNEHNGDSRSGALPESDVASIKEEAFDEHDNSSSRSAQSSSDGVNIEQENEETGTESESESDEEFSVHAMSEQSDFDDSSSDGGAVKQEDEDAKYDSSDEWVSALSYDAADEDEDEDGDEDEDEAEAEDGRRSGSDGTDNDSDHDAPNIKLENASSDSPSSSDEPDRT